MIADIILVSLLAALALVVVVLIWLWRAARAESRAWQMSAETYRDRLGAVAVDGQKT